MGMVTKKSSSEVSPISKYHINQSRRLYVVADEVFEKFVGTNLESLGFLVPTSVADYKKTDEPHVIIIAVDFQETKELTKIIDDFENRWSTYAYKILVSKGDTNLDQAHILFGAELGARLVAGGVKKIEQIKENLKRAFIADQDEGIYDKFRREIDYAVKYINYSDADICVLQHEFGIFGGESGVYILPLINRLEIPLVVVFHTVLRDPSYNEKMVVQEIGRTAEKIVVMSKLAATFLNDIYDVPLEKIAVIEHGVPDYDIQDNRVTFKKKFKLEDKKVLLTFGLLSRNKGIETAIESLPAVVKKHPELVYIILGRTHPSVVRHAGEEYRNYLQRLVDRLNLGNNVYFKDEFVSNDELFGYLSAADIYVTPYLNKAQITSGTLAYAVGAGNAVVSTPYWHAEELLAEGRGILFGFGDSSGLSKVLNDLLDNPDKLAKHRQTAYDYGRKTLWPECGYQYYKLMQDAVTKRRKEPAVSSKEAVINLSIIPTFDLSHLERITDCTGIIQHAKFSVPNRKEGYCLDDTGRALLLAAMAVKQKKDLTALSLIPTYLSYIHYVQNDDGSFRNFISYDRRYLDEIGTEDAAGRAIWGLGYLIENPPTEPHLQLAREIFANAFPHFSNLKYIRGMANHIVGISHYLRRYPSDEGMSKILRQLTDHLVQQYAANRKDDWRWFEDELTYDNGLLPLALMHAYDHYCDRKVLEVAKESMEFLESEVFKDNYLSLIGSDHWYKRGGERSQYAQQPVDTMMMVLMYQKAAEIFKEKKYQERMFTSFKWFLGENDLRMPLYDFETHGCCDGLEDYGVNRNQGAESTLAYLISHLSVLKLHI
jgi:glycosyltransferase involved in cell wall biosynthesis